MGLVAWNKFYGWMGWMDGKQSCSNLRRPVPELNAAEALPELSSSLPALFPLIKPQQRLNIIQQAGRNQSQKSLEKKHYVK